MTPLATLVVFAASFAMAGPPRAEPVSFRNGDVVLAGTLHRPAGPGRHAAVVVFHASGTPLRSDPLFEHLAIALPRNGLAVLLFDRRGSGGSTGDFRTASFRDLAADGIAGVEYLKTRGDLDPHRIGVWGLSQGGWLAPLAATMSKDVAFAVSVSGPGVTPAQQMDYSARFALRAAGQPPAVIGSALEARAKLNAYYRGRASREEAQQAIDRLQGESWFEQTFLPATVPENPSRTKWFQEMDYEPLPVLERLRVPAIFFFAEIDPWVPVEESIAKIRAATAKNPAVTIRRIEGTGHYMEIDSTPNAHTSQQYIDALVEWLRNRR